MTWSHSICFPATSPRQLSFSLACLHLSFLFFNFREDENIENMLILGATFVAGAEHKAANCGAGIAKKVQNSVLVASLSIHPPANASGKAVVPSAWTPAPPMGDLVEIHGFCLAQSPAAAF